MLSYKQYMATLNSEGGEMLSPEAATKKYHEYKTGFRRDQIAKFFAVHKDEEWFKWRYHPDDAAKRKDEQRGAIRRRLLIFNRLIAKFSGPDEEQLSLDMTLDSNRKKLYKFIDACMIMLEGGEEKDLEILESIYDLSKNPNLLNDLAEMGEVEKNGSDDESEPSEIEEGDEEEGEEEDDGNLDPERPKLHRTKKKAKKAQNGEESEDKMNISESNGDKKKDDVRAEKSHVEKKETNESENEKSERFSTYNIPQKTQSIFFKHLPVIVTRQDLEEVNL